MNGWIFAIGLLVAVLAFELVAFRYFSDVSLGGAFESGDPSATPPGGAPLEAGEPGAGTDVTAQECRYCGTVNEDVATFHYCQHCLARID